MSNIRLFVCCHRPEYVPKHPLLVPMQVGAALSDKRFDGFLQDDSGDNISLKNRSYCELTAQYWAWKNAQADYLGFFHYRRFLYPDVTARRPYLIRKEPTCELMNALGYNHFEDKIEEYDLIAPMGEDMCVDVREHYAVASNHHAKDLALMEQIIVEQHPGMRKSLETYLSGTVHYFGNIYIMRKKVFVHYCAWLFSLLEEFDKRADLTGYNLQEMRVNGYLAERMFGVYYTHRRMHLRTIELPRVHFYEGREYFRRRIMNVVLPPGTQRRAIVKRLRAQHRSKT